VFACISPSEVAHGREVVGRLEAAAGRCWVFALT